MAFQGVMKFKILVDLSLVIITIYLVYLIYAQEGAKYINFPLFIPKLPHVDVGIMEFFNFLSPYPTNVSCKFCEDWPNSS